MTKKINIHFVYVLLAASLWGIAGIFVRSVEDEVAKMQLVICRAVFSTLIFGIMILIKDKSLFKVKLCDLWIFISAGIFSIVIFNYSYYTTMSLTTLSAAAVLLYTAPFFVVIMSYFIFKEKFTLNKSAACFTAFVGCCFVTGLLDSSQSIGSKAIFFGLLTGFGYALYTIFSELLLRRGYKTLTITFYVFLFAAIGSLPFVNLKATVSGLVSSPKIFTMVFLMALLNTVLPYILYTAGLRGVNPSVAPIIATVEPVVATIVSVNYGETITVLGYVGIVLVLLSVVLLNVKRLSVIANAKINLTLGITGKREDGYHLLDTVMQSVTLSDKLIITPTKGEITVICKKMPLKGEENIAYKAAKLFFGETEINKGAKIVINKNIPEAAGMGGGSADAAAVLIALNKLYGAGLSDERLEQLAVKLGADVPFFIRGGTQRAEGIGEILTPLKDFKKGYFVLAKCEKKPSTAEMYRRVDSENPPLPETDNFIKALENDDYNSASKLFDNSFKCVWKNCETYNKLKKAGAENIALSGSGPTWFGYFNDKKSAKTVFKQLKSENVECYIAKPCDFAIKCD